MTTVEIVGSAVPAPSVSLPWSPGQTPLMLAPMQGLTNRAMRSLFIDWVRPDLVFTELMRINTATPIRRISAGVLREVSSHEGDVPLVVQLIGHGREALVAAARTAAARSRRSAVRSRQAAMGAAARRARPTEDHAGSQDEVRPWQAGDGAQGAGSHRAGWQCMPRTTAEMWYGDRRREPGA